MLSISILGQRYSPRVLNYKRDGFPPGAINIMRPGKWGNIFVIGRDGSRAEVCAKYKKYYRRNKKLQASIGELTGKDLICCCKPLECHGDFLLSEANP